MNTTTAAIQAGVTIDTIRTWCRAGVIAAIKQAGRWIIDTASLARRITIGAMRARKQTAVALDLNATYTANLPGYDGPVTITPTIKKRADRRTGAGKTTITGIVPLLADKLDSITDEGSRLHAVTVLHAVSIVLHELPDSDWDNEAGARDHGRIRTTYRGGVPGVTVDDVLDLAEQIRTQLSA